MKFQRSLRITLIDRYIGREILPPAFTGLLLFTVILVLNQIPTLLQTLISRSADAGTALKAFAHLLPAWITLTLPMGFLLGVLFAFGRMTSESEIIAMRASGFSAFRLLRPVMVLAVLATGATFYIYSIVTPRSNQAFRQLMFSLLQTSVRQQMKPRAFNEDLLPSRTLVVYAQDITPDTGRWLDVFISDRRVPQKPRIILARRGHLQVDDGARRVSLELENGSIANYEPDSGRYEKSFFQTAHIPIPADEIFPNTEISKGERELTIPEISARLRDMEARGATPKETARLEVEWHKRFAIPAACLAFGLIGLALSLGPRREARSAAFGVSIVVIAVYYVLLQVGTQMGNERVLPPWAALWLANMVLGGIAVLLLFFNQREAAFDPLDLSRLRAVLPAIRRSVRRKRATQEPAPPPAPAAPPRTTTGFPSIIDRYITRIFVRNLALILGAFVSIFVVADFMDLIDDIHQNRVRGITVVKFYMYLTPYIVHLVVPIAILVTVLATFGMLARRNEITALKSVGVSLYRTIAPTLALAAVGSMVLWAMTEFVLPQANLRASFEKNVIKGRPRIMSTYLDRRWSTGPDGKFYNFDFVSQDGPLTFHGLSVFEVDPRTWHLRDHLSVATARWDGLAYELDRGFRAVMTQPASGLPVNRVYQIASVRTREIEAPTFFQREKLPPDTLRYGQLGEYIASLESLGLDATESRVQLYRKVAFPFVSIVMTLLAVPFAFTVARRGALYGVFLSIIVALLYWACLGTFEALGKNAFIPPLLAAWAPNLLFAAAGLYFMLGLDT